MVDEQEPAKRVVKRVVKKTVARPASPAGTAPRKATPAPPTVRYGRPVATAAKASVAKPSVTKPSVARPSTGAPSTATSSVSTPTAKATAQPVPGRSSAPRPTVTRHRPSIDLGATVAGARDLVGRAWWAVADTTSDAARATGRVTAARARTVAAWRLPHLHPYLASVVTGVLVGLLAVLLGLASLALFSAVRGVSSGGGLWGGLAFSAVAVVSVFAGEALLRGFGTPSARLTSVLAVILTIVAMLGLFLDVVDGTAGLVLVPLMGAAGYALSHWLVELAENTPPVVE
jgi:hypothetical protein